MLNFMNKPVGEYPGLSWFTAWCTFNIVFIITLAFEHAL